MAGGTFLLGAGCGALTGGSGGQALLDDPLGFQGSISGKLIDNQTTRVSTVDPNTSQTVPPGFDTDNTVVLFRDLDGDDLLGVNGQPFDGVPVASDGAFTADNLPVGVDFTVCGDIGRDGLCNIETRVTIPSDDDGPGGRLDGVRADPLTTLAVARLRLAVRDENLDVRDLPFSPATVVTRVVEAFVNLFEESGIDLAISLDDIGGLTLDELAELFDSVVPAVARAGMEVAEGRLRLAQANDLDTTALRVAEVFLRAGFPVADFPGPPDLSALAQLEGITVVDGDNKVSYVDTVVEPDRNFAVGSEREPDDEDALSTRPVLNDRLLMEMARLQRAGRRISLADLHDLLTSLDDGLGVRLVHSIDDPNFFGPALTVFETADGRGRAINLDRLFSRLADGGFDELDAASFDRREAALRTLLRDLLSGTLAPAFGRLFGAIISDRAEGIEAVARRIREARAHIPRSRFGPSTFFVVASGDSFDNQTSVSAVTVDAEVSSDGEVLSVTFNEAGDGRFFLSFTEGTDRQGFVELLVRETGRRLHGSRGPVRLRMANSDMFNAINDQPFIEFVSESGSFFPGTHVTVIRKEFEPVPVLDVQRIVDPNLDSLTADDASLDGVGVAELDESSEPNPHEQLFVLATGVGEDADPLRVDYDRATGIATFDPGGRHLLMFLDDSRETGLFALFNKDTGRAARDGDPADFFRRPLDRPDELEDFFNEVDDFDRLDEFGEFGDLFGDVFDELLLRDDGVSLVDDGSTTTDGSTDGAAPLLPAQLQANPDGGNALGDNFILVAAADIVGFPIERITFTRVFGLEVPNERFDSAGDPFFDDVNGNGVWDADEPTAQFRPTLFDPADWRSTDLRLYYRRAGDNASIAFDDADFDSSTPRTVDGVVLVPRTYLARLNAFRFGRPNTAINLLTAFAPPEFLDGTNALNRNTRVDIFTAIALINLVMDQVLNVEVDADFDGIGPLPTQRTLIDARLFITPINDPFAMLIRGFRARSVVR